MGSKNRKQQVRLFLGILLSEDSIEDAIEDAKRQINKMKFWVMQHNGVPLGDEEDGKSVSCETGIEMIN